MTHPEKSVSCAHEDFEARVDVNRIEDEGELVQFTAEVVVWCRQCGEKFGFRGPQAGFSWTEPRCGLDARRITLPLMSPAELALAGPLAAAERGPVVIEVDPQ